MEGLGYSFLEFARENYLLLLVGGFLANIVAIIIGGCWFSGMQFFMRQKYRRSPIFSRVDHRSLNQKVVQMLWTPILWGLMLLLGVPALGALILGLIGLVMVLFAIPVS